MAYCTQTDIEQTRIPTATLVDLTDDVGLGVVDTGVVDAAIAEAGELIDAHLRPRYTLPLAAVPPVLRGIAADIAAYVLYGRRQDTLETPERVAAAYRDAVRRLTDIRDGRLDIGLEETAEAEAAPEIVSQPALFGRDGERW